MSLWKVGVGVFRFFIDRQGLRPTTEKVQAILSYPRRDNVTKLRRFLGLPHFYRRRMRDAAAILAPLNA